MIRPGNLGIGLVLLLLVGLLSGSYPAFYLSRLGTGQLKDNLSPGGGKAIARKLLVVVQFFISIALIIGTISAYSQLNYLKKADLGFDVTRSSFCQQSLNWPDISNHLPGA